MKAMIASLALALVSAALPVYAQQAEQPMTCKTGPVAQEFGGTHWVVYSCSDNQTVIIVAPPENPAAPQFFTVRPDGKGVLASGEGSGKQEYSSKAFADVVKLKATDLANLVERTRAQPVAQTQ
ncbi:MULTISPECIES: hypothetical protein [Dyella]|uniref:Lysozyme inhibitor n=2 Tax=Dyella TaxID=231454 RepID=A0A4R0YG45_9GAMM|nr:MULTISPECIES: hypothetical protein [Dyella]TBR36227.1 hypothetical protein EYV96_16700 [Dyella terrae]TCI05884.1 hypothetical protein EZM97_35790 [Dyella soli]